MRRNLAIGTVLALVALAAAVAVAASASKKRGFVFTRAPATQSVPQGKTATYVLGLTRRGGFAGSVGLRVTGLPRGASARWRLSDGRRTKAIPMGRRGAILSVGTSKRVRPGRYALRVRGASGKLQSTAQLTLVVEKPLRSGFVIAATPATQTVVQGEPASYRIKVTRARGFRGRVTLTVRGLDAGAVGALSAAGFTTARDTEPGDYALLVAGRARVRGRQMIRYAAVGLVTAAPAEFGIAGDVEPPLHPGSRVPLDLTVTNPYSGEIVVTSLSAEVAETSGGAGCSAPANFRTAPGGLAPLHVPPGSWRLSQLAPDSSAWPALEMLALPGNQDACQGAQLRLEYRGTAGR